MKRKIILFLVLFIFVFLVSCENEKPLSDLKLRPFFGGEHFRAEILLGNKQEHSVGMPLFSNEKIERFEILKYNGENIDDIEINYDFYDLEHKYFYRGYFYYEIGLSLIGNHINKKIDYIEIKNLELSINDKNEIYEIAKLKFLNLYNSNNRGTDIYFMGTGIWYPDFISYDFNAEIKIKKNLTIFDIYLTNDINIVAKHHIRPYRSGDENVLIYKMIPKDDVLPFSKVLFSLVIKYKLEDDDEEYWITIPGGYTQVSSSFLDELKEFLEWKDNYEK